MFAVLYSFKVIPGKSADFVAGWAGLTRLIFEHENSLGSRLHKIADDRYIAYAQWPDRSTWANAGSRLPEKATQFRRLMKASCHEIITDAELDVVYDLLQDESFTNQQEKSSAKKK